MQGQDEAALDVADRRSAGGRGDRLRQQPHIDAARLDGAQVAAGRRCGPQRLGVGQAGEHDAGWVGDLGPVRVEIEQERVRGGRDGLIRLVRLLDLRQLPVERGDRGVDADLQGPVDVRVERAQADERRRRPDAEHEERDQRQGDDDQPATR